jgi:protease IV
MRKAAAALAVPLLAGAICACEGRPRAGSAGGGTTPVEPRSGPAIAVLDLDEGVPEQPPSGLLGLAPRGGAFDALVREIERLGRAKDVHGVLVRLGAARIGLARSAEIGGMLEQLGAKVPVWCHADDMANGTLWLAARGCKKVWLSPAGSVDAIGLAAQTIYFHKLLADEIGLDVDFLQIGKYKGAEEPFTRDGPSPEARESLQGTLAGMRAAWLAGITSARPGVESATPEDGPYDAPDAKQRGLVDEIGYLDEARDALEKDAGAVRAETRFGGASSSRDGDELSDLLRIVAGESLSSAPVALVRATGAISLEGGGGGGLLGESGGIVERHLSRVLLRLEKDDDVKAVVLRIDSPGGSALASDLLWHRLMRLRAKKPLVVSVGGMAASGGYYLASAGAVVFADPSSIVGSIGVVGGKVSADRALEKIGVHAETIAAKPGDARAATRAAYESLLSPWDDATRDRLRQTMTGIYDLFLSRVAEGRGIPVERVAASAEGRIFAGEEGRARGLVDEIGGLEQAIARAREMGGLAEDARVGAVDEPAGLIEALAGDDPPGTSAVPRPVASAPHSAALSRVTAELAPFVESVEPLLGHERVVCAVPFAIAVH